MVIGVEEVSFEEAQPAVQVGFGPRLDDLPVKGELSWRLARRQREMLCDRR